MTCSRCGLSICACPEAACRACGCQICTCPDAIYAGVVVIDDLSEPGSWARHIRDTECMRERVPVHAHSDSETEAHHHVH